MSSIRNVLRNAALAYLPPRWTHRINMLKNVQMSALELEMRIVSNLVPRGCTVIDVGANLGLYSEIFARNASKVIAVEPQPKLAAYLREVLPPHVEVVQTALSYKNGETQLRIPKFSNTRIGSMDALATIENANTLDDLKKIGDELVTVQIQMLDDIAKGYDNIGFIKIDVEGHESSVVAGAMATIRTCRPTLMIEIEMRHNPKAFDLFDVFAVEGYEVCALVDNGQMQILDKAQAVILQTPQTSTAREVLDSVQHVANFFFVHRDDQRRKTLLG